MIANIPLPIRHHRMRPGRFVGSIWLTEAAMGDPRSVEEVQRDSLRIQETLLRLALEIERKLTAHGD